MSNYILTGGAGHVGAAVIRALLQRGERVRALLLPGQAPKVADAAVEYVEGDVCRPETLAPLFRESEGAVVIHTAALISIARKVDDRVRFVNVEGTQNVLARCREAGVKRLIHVCSSHAIPELPRGQVQREIDDYDPDRVEGCYAKTPGTGWMRCWCCPQASWAPGIRAATTCFKW